jgi:hypothetical protein
VAVSPERELRKARRQLREKEEELRQLRRRLESPQVMGTALDILKVNPAEWWIVETAMRLNHYVLVRPIYNETEFKLRIMAVKP